MVSGIQGLDACVRLQGREPPEHPAKLCGPAGRWHQNRDVGRDQRPAGCSEHLYPSGSERAAAADGRGLFEILRRIAGQIAGAFPGYAHLCAEHHSNDTGIRREETAARTGASEAYQQRHRQAGREQRALLCGPVGSDGGRERLPAGGPGRERRPAPARRLQIPPVAGLPCRTHHIQRAQRAVRPGGRGAYR